MGEVEKKKSRKVEVEKDWTLRACEEKLGVEPRLAGARAEQCARC